MNLMHTLLSILVIALLAPAAVSADEPLSLAQGESQRILSGESDVQPPAVGETSESSSTAEGQGTPVASTPTATAAGAAALRLFTEEDLRQSPLPRKEGPYRVKRGERVAICVDMSAEEFRGGGELKLFADKRWPLGTLGYHRYWKCANLHGVAFNAGGQRTLDVQKGGAWAASVQVTVE